MRAFLRLVIATAIAVVIAACSATRPDCAFALTVSSESVLATGGSGTATVTPSPSTPGCTWTAKSDASWLTLSGTLAGSRQTTFAFTAAANTGTTPRTGSLVVEWQGSRSEKGITQPGRAPVQLSTTELSIGANGGTFSFGLTSTTPWTAESDVPWLAVLTSTPALNAQGLTGSGNATVTVQAQANTGAARIGHVNVATQDSSAQLTITQAVSGTISVSPPSQDVPQPGGSFSFNVLAATSWTASVNVPWVTFTSSPSGTGNGTVNYSVQANTGAARSGTITVTGSGGSATVTVNQVAVNVCSLGLNPNSSAVGLGGVTGATTALTAANCGTWTAASDQSFITITSATTGTGNATITYNVAANSGAARSGHITVTSGSTTAQLTITQPSAILTASFTVSFNPPAGIPSPDANTCYLRASVVGGQNGNDIFCTFDGSGSSGPIQTYEYRFADPNGTLLAAASASPSLSNGRTSCGFGTGQFTENVYLVIRNGGSSANTFRAITFKKDNGC